ncbi:MAG: cysteine desulfurase [Lachnospiraceae bacterium]|nr:cysteine desulfurase [Lachnospiraceae bacterium]
MEVYLDNSATTRVYDEVAALMKEVMLEDYGNPSSMHNMGVRAEKYVREATEILAGTLKVKEKELIYTSCGTESDNMALIGTYMANKRAGNHIISTKIEHPAVKEPLKYLEEQGAEVTLLGTDEYGCVSVEDLKKAIRKDTILVSVMHTNNESGAVQPIEEIGAMLKKQDHKILFHVDAVQGYGKARIYPKRAGLDLLSVSAHKIHGPKGMGLLYVDEKVKIKPVILGGGQQKGLRSGTENVPGIAGLAKAAEIIYEDFDEKLESLYELKGYFMEGLKGLDGLLGINGEKDDIKKTAPHIISASFDGIRAEVLLHALEEKGIYVSSGSACSSNKPSISETLLAMGAEKKRLDSTVRFSMSFDTTREEIDYTLSALRELLPVLSKYRIK